MPARSPGTLYLLTRPSMFLLHLPAVLAVVAAVLLGNWQIDAWQMHREDRAAALADAEPVPLEDVLGADEVFPADGVGRPVTLAGRWLPEDTVQISDRVHGGEEGFWQVVPVLTCGSSSTGCPEPAAMPVVLGWTPTLADPPPPPSGQLQLTGWLQPGEASAGPDPDLTDTVLPALRIADLLQRVDQDLYGGFVILDKPAELRDGLVAVTPESLPDPPTSTALRNLLYGVEWWFFAGFAVFLWWRWTKDEVAAARARAASEQEAPVTPLSPETDEVTSASAARIPSEP